MNEETHQFPFSEWNTMDGWCVPQILEVLQPLDAFQRKAQKQIGPVAEIGVYHGKFFVLLAWLKRGSAQKHLAIDVFDMQEFNLDGAGVGNFEVFTESLNTFQLTNQVNIEASDSLHIDNAVLQLNAGKFDFFSIDGCHTKLHTINDIRVAEKMLSTLGVLFVDDYTNSSWPGVKDGVVAYLTGNHGNLVPLAVTSNKLLMCSASMHKIYFDFLNEFQISFGTSKVSEIEIVPTYKTLWLEPDYSKSLSDIWMPKRNVMADIDACKVEFLDRAQSGLKILDANVDTKISFNSTNSVDEIAVIERYLRKSKNFLEFGSGYSTVLASKNVSEAIVSVETDLAYIAALRMQVSSGSNRLPSINFIHADIGPVEAWGTPSDDKNQQKWTNYQTMVLNYVHKNNWKPDLTLIDGHFRVATFMSIYLNFPGSTIIFDDYVDRPEYHVIEKVLRPSKTFGRVTVFEVPRWRTRKRLAIASLLLSANILNSN
jgi:hypothetical protein